MALALTLPGLTLDLSRNCAYIQIGKLVEACLGRAVPGSSFWEASRFELGAGFQLVAGPFALDIGRPTTT